MPLRVERGQHAVRARDALVELLSPARNELGLIRTGLRSTTGAAADHDAAQLELQHQLAHRPLLRRERVGPAERQPRVREGREVRVERDRVLVVHALHVGEGRRAEREQVGAVVQVVLVDEGVPRGVGVLRGISSW